MNTRKNFTLALVLAMAASASAMAGAYHRHKVVMKSVKGDQITLRAEREILVVNRNKLPKSIDQEVSRISATKPTEIFLPAGSVVSLTPAPKLTLADLK